MSFGREAWLTLTQFPHLSFATLVLVVASPLLLSVKELSPGRAQFAIRYRRLAISLAALAGVVAAVRYLVLVRPLVEGVDFYHYVLTARDNLHGVSVDRLERFAYFPGAYRIWEFAMTAFGESLGALQWTVIGLLALNALLVAAIVSRVIGRPAFGVVAGLWYLALASKLEGLAGTTEPSATAFALAGLLAWGGAPLKGRAGVVRAVAFGTGLGLAVWTKQQGGLVSIGAVALLIAWMIAPREDRPSLLSLVLVPAVAVAVFLGAVLAEGEGLSPLLIGLGRVGTYEVEGSLLSNLRSQWVQLGAIGWLALVALVSWLATLAWPRFRELQREPWLVVVGFSSIASVATLVQFSRRSYLHYGLLAAPFLAIASVIILDRLFDSSKLRGPVVRTLVGGVLVYALAFPLIAFGSGPSYFHVWPPSKTVGAADGSLWHDAPTLAADIGTLKAFVSPEDRMLVCPQRRNAIHFMLGTRSPSYRWGGRRPADIVRSGAVDFVVVLDRSVLDPTDLLTWEVQGTDEALTALESVGFVEVARLDTMTLWGR